MKNMNKRIDELKAERANVLSTLFLVRCAISLFTVLFVVRFGFEKPVTVAVMGFAVMAVPFVLYCYDKLTSAAARGQPETAGTFGRPGGNTTSADEMRTCCRYHR